MTIEELRAACEKGVAESGGIVQLVSTSQRPPFPRKGWPKGELLCDNIPSGGSVWLYDAVKLLLALDENMRRFRKTIGPK